LDGQRRLQGSGAGAMMQPTTRDDGAPHHGQEPTPDQEESAMSADRNPAPTIDHPRAVSHQAWVAARKSLLQKEKELTRLNDRIAAERRALPWEKVEKEYRFEGPDGVETLAELFDGRSQLIVYHFMFGPGWNEGCDG